MVKELLQSSCLPSDSGLPLPRDDDDDADDEVALDNIASIGPMMTSRADVMQTGVVIGQAAEHVHLSVCVCVRMLGQRESMQRPLGLSAVSQSFGRTLALYLRLHWRRKRVKEEKWKGGGREEGKEEGKQEKERKKNNGRWKIDKDTEKKTDFFFFFFNHASTSVMLYFVQEAL